MTASGRRATGPASNWYPTANPKPPPTLTESLRSPPLVPDDGKAVSPSTATTESARAAPEDEKKLAARAKEETKGDTQEDRKAFMPRLDCNTRTTFGRRSRRSIRRIGLAR